MPKSEKHAVLGSKISSARSTLTLQAKKTQLTPNQSAIKPQPVGNSLDSTAPKIKRGKEREIPKKKRPTKMRKIIAAERAARLNLKELDSIRDDTPDLHRTTDKEVTSKNDPSCMKDPTNIVGNLENEVPKVRSWIANFIHS